MLLDFGWINTISDTPLDCTRKLLLIAEAIETNQNSPNGTKVKSEYGINSKRTALRQFKSDLKSARKDLEYWFNTSEGLERLEETPELLDSYFGLQFSPKSDAPIAANCLF